MGARVAAARRPAVSTAIAGDLNPEQRRAVATTEGPLLVLAGAGSGKTRVITCRIAHLLERGVAPRQVLAVTFTNKAAREMKERVGALVGPAAKDLTIGTFHSFCVRLLREHAAVIGLPPRFAICDESDQQTAIKGALRELRIPEARLHPRAALSRISLLKNRMIDPGEAAKAAVDPVDHLVAKAYRAYEAQLRRSRVVDFDDLLVLAARMLADHADVLERLQDRYRYLLVDEYQDTNGPQYELLRLLAGKRANLCVVGDDDQSIYGWRGADVKKILSFNRDFPDAAVVRLETNYRSTSEILDAANAVIANNPNRHDKKLKSAAGPGEAVRLLELEDEEHEAEFVVSEINHEVRQGRLKFGDVAILFRTATQPRTFEARLRSMRIPYELVGGMSFFDRKEVRDVLAYLRCAANPLDEPSLLRVVNVPPRGVGKTSIDRLLDFATKKGLSAAVAVEDPSQAGDAFDTIRGFRRLLAGVEPNVAKVGLAPAIRELLLAVRYTDEIDRCYEDPVARQTRWAAVEEVFNMAENYVRRTTGPTLPGFLEDIALSTQEQEEDEDGDPRDVVTLMTLHAAKGLEFKRVYLVGAEEGILPHQRSIEEDTIEEERRVMYVGITRARRHLTITRAKSRAKYGRRDRTLPSRFLFEMKGETPPFPIVRAMAAKAEPAEVRRKKRAGSARKGRTGPR